MTRLSDAQLALKAATRRAVQLAGGPVQAAEVTRADAGRLSRYGSIEDPMFVPIDIAADLDRAAGDHVLLRAWANLNGFELTARARGADGSADLQRQVGGVAREAGELISAALEATADGKLSPTEARKLDGEAGDLEQRVVELRSAIRPKLSSAG